MVRYALGAFGSMIPPKYFMTASWNVLKQLPLPEHHPYLDITIDGCYFIEDHFVINNVNVISWTQIALGN